MSYRSWDIKVQPETWNRLKSAINLYGLQEEILPEPGCSGAVKFKRIITVDELADRALGEVIKEKYPAVLELERKLRQVEYDAARALREAK